MFKLASGTLPARLGSGDLLRQGVPRDASWTSPADSDRGHPTWLMQGTSSLFRGICLSRIWGPLGGERGPGPKASSGDGERMASPGVFQSLLLQELPASLSLAVFPLLLALCSTRQHPVGRALLGSRAVKRGGACLASRGCSGEVSKDGCGAFSPPPLVESHQYLRPVGAHSYYII